MDISLLVRFVGNFLSLLEQNKVIKRSQSAYHLHAYVCQNAPQNQQSVEDD